MIINLLLCIIKMPIIMFNMKACHFCKKAKKMLKNEIADGTVVVKPHTDITGVGGFPHFTSADGTKSHTGCPESAAFIIKKLGDVSEGYSSRGSYYDGEEVNLGNYSLTNGSGCVIAGYRPVNPSHGDLGHSTSNHTDLSMGVF
jgi:glutaredoxin